MYMNFQTYKYNSSLKITFMVFVFQKSLSYDLKHLIR